MYHIFKVHDYKGGELESTINVNDVGRDLAELFEGSFEDDESIAELSLKDIEDVVLAECKSIDKQLYANETSVVRVFKSNPSGKLSEVKMTKLYKEIARYIKSNWE